MLSQLVLANGIWMLIHQCTTVIGMLNLASVEDMELIMDLEYHLHKLVVFVVEVIFKLHQLLQMHLPDIINMLTQFSSLKTKLMLMNKLLSYLEKKKILKKMLYQF